MLALDFILAYKRQGGTMSNVRLGKAVNGFLLKEKKRNGSSEGEQSMNNQRTYIYAYDSQVGDFVGKWIDTPTFVRKPVNTH